MVRRQTGMLTSKADPGSSALPGRNPSPNAALYIDNQWKWPHGFRYRSARRAFLAEKHLLGGEAEPCQPAAPVVGSRHGPR